MENKKHAVMSIPEVCEEMGLSRPIITAFIKRKDNPLPCIVTTARRGRYVIPRAAFEQWLLDEATRNSAVLRR